MLRQVDHRAFVAWERIMLEDMGAAIFRRFSIEALTLGQQTRGDCGAVIASLLPCCLVLGARLSR